MRLLLTIILLFAAQGALAQQNKFLEYFRTIQNGQVVGNGIFREKVPSVQEIQSSLSKFNSDADFLSYLLTSYPHLKNNYILVHKSESQQLSSIAHPRIIIFGGGAAFAFSESPLQKDRRVEILTTDSKTFEVSLHEITFKHGQAQFESNPQSCLSCHGSPSRALWNPYDFWPNTFGSAVGSMGTRNEAKAYNDLKANAAQSQLLSQLALPEKYGNENEAVTAFTMFTSGLNQGRWITQHLKKGSGFDKVAKQFIAVIGQCIGNGSFQKVPEVERMKEYMGSATVERNLPVLNQYIQDQVAARNAFKGLLDSTLAGIFPEPVFYRKVDHTRLGDEALWLAYMRWILSMGGVDSSDLSPSLFGNDTLISSPGNFLVEFSTALYDIRPDLFTDFKVRFQDFAPGSTIVMPDCASLLESIKKDPAQEVDERHFVSFREDAASRPVLSRCSKCHSEGLGNMPDVPFIPFNDPPALAQALRAPQSKLQQKIEARVRSHGADQMPPMNRLSEKEIESLKSFLDNLK